MSYVGITPNKPYLVLDEKSKVENKTIHGVIELMKTGTLYKIQDDYFNIRWVDSVWFLELYEWRGNKINRLLD